MKVESKYKNPDRYIEKLKNEKMWAERRADNWRDDYREARGAVWFDYEEDVSLDVTLTTEQARQFRIKDEVIIRGTINKMEAGCSQITVTFDHFKVYGREI